MVQPLIGALGSGGFDHQLRPPVSTTGLPPPGPILYTKGVQAHWRDAAVGAQGELRLEGLPFEPGQPVEVLVISKTAGSTAAGDRSLRDSVLEYRDPMEPVAGEDWDALQ